MPSSRADTAEGLGALPDSRAAFLSLFPSIVLPMFLAALDGTIVATALPAIAAGLGDVERVSWVVVSYLIATTIAAPVYGRLGDALGRRRMLFVALGVFVASSVLCAVAPTVLALSAARVLQGLGGGGLLTQSQALIGEAVPPRERGRYQAYTASGFMVASTFGPVAGGWLTQHFGWPSVFLINLPLGALAIALALRLPARGGSGGRLHFDFLGVVLFAGTVAPLLLALERMQHFDAAALPEAGGLAALATLFFVLLLRQERRARFPLLPLSLLRQAAIWRTDAMAACVGAMIVSLVTFMPIFLQVARGATPSETGLLLLPLTGCVAVGSMVTGRMMSRTGRTAIFPSIGLIVVTASLLVLALGTTSLGTARLPWVFAVCSLALGTVMPVVQLTVQMVAGPKQLGAASASVQLSRSIGAALGTAAVGTVLFATLSVTDPQTAALFVQMVERGPDALSALETARRLTVQAEVAQAFRAAFLMIAGFAGTGLLLAWTIPVRRL